MTLIESTYNNILMELDGAGMQFGIRRRQLETLLMAELGVVDARKIETHIRAMIVLGYIRVADKGWGPESITYDLMAPKLRSVRKKMRQSEKATKQKELDG